MAKLVSLPKVSPLPQVRLADERQVFRVTARVTLVRREPDGDLHLVVRDDAGNHLIAEVPSNTCVTGAARLRQRQMAAARASASVCRQALITGVLFHDFFHHQTGVAPNVIELHPLLTFRCLSP